MKLTWSDSSLADLSRFHGFLLPKSRRAAAKAIADIREGARKLLVHPLLGQRVEDIDGRSLRYIFVGDYELRYEARAGEICVVRIFHMREER